MIEHRNYNVLVVDDDPSISRLIEIYLTRQGFGQIDKAADGAQAQQKLKLSLTETQTGTYDCFYDVVVLDVMLPDINGFELCRIVKDASFETLVILISGYDIADLHQRLLDSNADDFLSKPFKPLELVARIDMYLEKQQRQVGRKMSQETRDRLQSVSSYQVPHIGDSVDHYEIIDSLGWGKSSVIYKVMDKDTNCKYAMKLLTRYSMDFAEVVERFEHETKVLSQLNHPNVIGFHETGRFNGCPYIVMEYVHGVNLEEYLMSFGTPDFELIFRVSLQLASALDAVHYSGIVHRDIKLSNILMLPDSQEVKLTDFGISRSLERRDGLTQDGFIVGTPMYMAPEVFVGDNFSPASDLYSYGVSMYQFAAGVPPFTGMKTKELYQKHAQEKPKPMRDYNAKIPEEFERLIIDRCMAKYPEDRPESGHDLIVALTDICEKYGLDAGDEWCDMFGSNTELDVTCSPLA